MSARRGGGEVEVEVEEEERASWLPHGVPSRGTRGLVVVLGAEGLLRCQSEGRRPADGRAKVWRSPGWRGWVKIYQ